MLQLKETTSLRLLDQVIKDSFQADLGGHDYDHIKRVVNLTTLFLKEVTLADPFVTLCIAYLHDVFDHKIQKVDNVETAMLDYLSTLNIEFFGKEEHIAKGCTQVGYSIQHTVLDKHLEANIVSDADYMDAIGPFGLIRTIQYGIQNDHSIEVMVAHLPEKLLHLKDLMVTQTAKDMAVKRHQLLEDFYQLYLESKL